jgi:hypothetical protein
LRIKHITPREANFEIDALVNDLQSIDPRIEVFFRRVNATVLIKPFRLEALDSASCDVFAKLR